MYYSNIRVTEPVQLWKCQDIDISIQISLFFYMFHPLKQQQ